MILADHWPEGGSSSCFPCADTARIRISADTTRTARSITHVVAVRYTLEDPQKFFFRGRAHRCKVRRSACRPRARRLARAAVARRKRAEPVDGAASAGPCRALLQVTTGRTPHHVRPGRSEYPKVQDQPCPPTHFRLAPRRHALFGRVSQRCAAPLRRSTSNCVRCAAPSGRVSSCGRSVTERGRAPGRPQAAPSSQAPLGGG